MNRFSSRKTDLGKQFLTDRLRGAVTYDRIAGYFCSSCLEIAGEGLENVKGKVRVICNTDLTPADVKVAWLANQKVKQEWCDFKPEEVYAQPTEMARLGRLYKLFKSGKLEVRVIPDELYGFVHGKAGVITYEDGSHCAFVGSMNETFTGMFRNYEIVWEDNSEEAARWVQNEFDFFWNHPSAKPLCDFVIEDILRIANRRTISIKDWREGESPIGSIVAEDPITREEIGLWPHQKYFVSRAFAEHQTPGGARLILADEVGLGKTLQLAMTAKLMALYGDKPILIIVPKTLLTQWQEEMKSMLDIPSAVWMGNKWVDENGMEYKTEITQCPKRIGLVSQGLIFADTNAVDQLLNLEYECVICDEAHKARRKNLGMDADRNKAQPNNLLKFLDSITYKTKSMLLATATPVQLYPIEAFDLLLALGIPSFAEKVLGNEYSVWRTSPQTTITYISNNVQPKDTRDMWNLLRNPFPMPVNGDTKIAIIRLKMNMLDDEFVIEKDWNRDIDSRIQDRFRSLYNSEDFVQNYNPYVRCIVKRTRNFLENTINPATGETYLKKINVKLYGEKDEETLILNGVVKNAYDTAEALCKSISKEVKGGFIKTLMLKRIGSSLIAGENTAKSMLAWCKSGDSIEIEEMIEDENDRSLQMKTLKPEEVEMLQNIVTYLAHNRDEDPKYKRTVELLKEGIDGSGPWKDRGCIIFSQYYDTSRYIAEKLSFDFKDTPIGLYAGGDKSGIYIDGMFEKLPKDELKLMVRQQKLKILVGTDAASEGLNLQMLSTLINIDLPWNPTRLEQRKGRIQRIGQVADTILLYNMRYKGSVEDRVHAMLSERLKGIYDMFGQIPEVLSDVWIHVAENEVEKAKSLIRDLPTSNPFIAKYENINNMSNCEDWEKCSDIVSNKEKKRILNMKWK